MNTLAQLAERFGYVDLAVEYPELEIPVLGGLQRQGDVLIRPCQQPLEEFLAAVADESGESQEEFYEVVEGEPGVPLDGVVVVESELGGNTHALHGDGRWYAADLVGWRFWDRVGRSDRDTVVGWFTVPAGGEAYLIHSEEHGALGIAPGFYEVRRQQEMRSGRWATVED
jgi:hypothetical protein